MFSMGVACTLHAEDLVRHVDDHWAAAHAATASIITWQACDLIRSLRLFGGRGRHTHRGCGAGRILGDGEQINRPGRAVSLSARRGPGRPGLPPRACLDLANLVHTHRAGRRRLRRCVAGADECCPRRQVAEDHMSDRRFAPVLSQAERDHRKRCNGAEVLCADDQLMARQLVTSGLPRALREVRVVSSRLPPPIDRSHP